jgi:hypothetical protein
MPNAHFDRVLRVLTTELKEIVSSYFSPVTAVVKGDKRMVEPGSRHPYAVGKSNSEREKTRH